MSSRPGDGPQKARIFPVPQGHFSNRGDSGKLACWVVRPPGRAGPMQAGCEDGDPRPILLPKHELRGLLQTGNWLPRQWGQIGTDQADSVPLSQ